MPLTNRVTPWGEIVALAGRGTMMGNRGVLHDAQRSIVRDSQVRRWIACRLEFRERQRVVMTPGRYTELFFLDEATALAAGHRPCAECRRADFDAFRAAWQAARQLDAPPSAAAMDAVLHTDRRAGPHRKRTFRADIRDLPDGAFVELDGEAFLVMGDRLLAWSAEGYRQPRVRPPSGGVTVLTPAASVAVLRAGYRVQLHPTASAQT
jgi:hypothetical protein